MSACLACHHNLRQHQHQLHQIDLIEEEKRMRKVAVVGIGETKFSGPQTKTEVELFAEAATDAMKDANVKPKDIQALYMGNCLGDFSEGQGMVQAYAAENIGCRNIPANRYEGACASASSRRKGSAPSARQKS
jgi:3-oxoacyl-[acyl-carrier-protein] synthase III